ncbi:CbrC family protein [Trichococcus flocculiformis]|nr:CbrC family protein [Trichococcus flocculiformis]
MFFSRKLPKFKYNENPVGNGIIVKESGKCPVCGKKTDYVYKGPFYSAEEAEDICPWCIADGSAAKKFNGEFQDYDSCEEVDNEDYTDELVRRTPGYCGWQKEQWLSHCGDYCSFVGNVGWKELEMMGLVQELREDLEKYGLNETGRREHLVKGGSLQGYLFKCVVCGKHRLAVDSNLEFTGLPDANTSTPQTGYAGGFRLENFFDAPVENPTWEQVEKHIKNMMEVGKEHVLLSLKEPHKGIRFIQAVSVDDGYDVQLGIEKNGGTNLVSRVCSTQELFELFSKFYNYADVDGAERFTPVEISRKTYTGGEGKPPIWIQPIIETGKMYDLDFFHFTDMLDWSKQGNDEAVLDPLVSFLSTYGDNVIFAFEDKMTELLYALDTYDIAKHLIEDWGYISSDGFLYARCMALVNGKSYYTAILKGKKKLSKDMEFESLLYVPRNAWCRLHHERDDNYPHKTELSYETFSNKKGWENTPRDIGG